MPDKRQTVLGVGAVLPGHRNAGPHHAVMPPVLCA